MSPFEKSPNCICPRSALVPASIGGDCVTAQAPATDDRRAGELRGRPEEFLPWICGDAQLGHELSYYLTDRQDQDFARGDEGMKKAAASGIYRMQRFVRTLQQDQSAVEAAVEQDLEQWSGGRTQQSAEDTQATDVDARVSRLVPACTNF